MSNVDEYIRLLAKEKGLELILANSGPFWCLHGEPDIDEESFEGTMFVWPSGMEAVALMEKHSGIKYGSTIDEVLASDVPCTPYGATLEEIESFLNGGAP